MKIYCALLLVLVLLAGTQPAIAQEDAPLACPGAPPLRLLVDEVGRVTPGAGNRMRDQPSVAGAEVGFIPGGESFAVLDGPVCADDFAWWQVEYGAVTGWTVEGAGDEYWLEPVLAVDLVFASWVSGESKLMAMDDLGENVVDLGESGVFQMTPSIAPDGTCIAYLAELPDGTAQLRLMPLAGGEALVLDGGLEYGYSGFNWSPDGTQITFTLDSDRGQEEDNANVYIINADGSGRRALTGGTREHLTAVWSPDGTQLVFAATLDDGTTHLHIMDVASGQARVIPAEGYSPGPAIWSPDGTQIAFSAFVPDVPLEQSSQVFVISPNGSNLRQPTGGGLHANAPVWSPDGGRLAFISTRTGNPELFTVNGDGSDLRQITTTEASEACPAWSPDGIQIAFTADPDGNRGPARSEAYMVNADGSDLRRLTDNDRREECPLTWNPAE